MIEKSKRVGEKTNKKTPRRGMKDGACVREAESVREIIKG